MPVYQIGVDEVGRGALAGPVVAAAVLCRSAPRGLVKDSKRLSASARLVAGATIAATSRWSLSSVSAAVIDHSSIRDASLMAMERACCALLADPKLASLRSERIEILIDGLVAPPHLATQIASRWPEFTLSIRTEAKADCHYPAVAWASILAKVWRDRWMIELAKLHPQYGFDQHKGYGTPQHRQALRLLGPCDWHRHSFRPISQPVA